MGGRPPAFPERRQMKTVEKGRERFEEEERLPRIKEHHESKNTRWRVWWLVGTSFFALLLLGLKHPIVGLVLPPGWFSVAGWYFLKHSGDSSSSW